MIEKIKLFLKDLDKLTAKHGIVIEACGCCGSPWLAVKTEDHPEIIASYLDYVEGRYVVRVNGQEDEA